MQINKMVFLYVLLSGIFQSALLGMENFFDSFKENLYQYGHINDDSDDSDDSVDKLGGAFKLIGQESNVKTVKLKKDDDIKIVHSVENVLKYEGELIAYLGIGTFSDAQYELGYLQSLPSFLEKFIKDSISNKNLQGKIKIILIDETWGNDVALHVGDFEAVGYEFSSLKNYIDAIQDEAIKKAIKESIVIVDKNISADDLSLVASYAKTLLDNFGALFLGEGVRNYEKLMSLISKVVENKDEAYKSRLQLISVYTMQIDSIKRGSIDSSRFNVGNPIWWGSRYNQDDYDLILGLKKDTEENKIYIESEKCAGKFVALTKEESEKNNIPELKFAITWKTNKKDIEKIIPLMKKWDDKKIWHSLGDVLQSNGELITYIGFGTVSPANKQFGYLQSLPEFVEKFFSIKELEGKIKIVLVDKAWSIEQAYSHVDYPYTYEQSSLKKYLNDIKIKNKNLAVSIEKSIYLVDQYFDEKDVDLLYAYAKNLIDAKGAIFIADSTDSTDVLSNIEKVSKKLMDAGKSGLVQFFSMYYRPSCVNDKGVSIVSRCENKPIWWEGKFISKDWSNKVKEKENQNKKYPGNFFAPKKDKAFSDLPGLTFAIEFNTDKTGIEKVVPILEKV